MAVKILSKVENTCAAVLRPAVSIDRRTHATKERERERQREGKRRKRGGEFGAISQLSWLQYEPCYRMSPISF